MKVSRLVRYTLGISAAAALCAGCSNGAPNTLESGYAQSLHRLPPSVTGFGPAKIFHPDHHRSWMAPDARKKDLLYISDQSGDVYVFSYPKGELKGTLTGFADPQGECVDKKGDVWISLFAAEQLVEYAHGGTSSIGTLSDPGYLLEGCSVDRTTGNLAAANFAGTSNSAGGVAIYADAQGTATTYSDPNLYLVFSVGYDNAGNLFADGETSGGSFTFAELPKGSGTFTNLTLNQTIKTPGTVQWDGTYITVGDASAGVTYQVSVSGSSATVVGSTTLGSSDGIFQSFIYHGTIIGPNAFSSNAMFWSYPAGGSPTKTLTGFTDPFGSAVSKRRR
jgi:hypothetical protein